MRRPSRRVAGPAAEHRSEVAQPAEHRQQQEHHDDAPEAKAAADQRQQPQQHPAAAAAESAAAEALAALILDIDVRIEIVEPHRAIPCRRAFTRS